MTMHERMAERKHERKYERKQEYMVVHMHGRLCSLCNA